MVFICNQHCARSCAHFVHQPALTDRACTWSLSPSFGLCDMPGKNLTRLSTQMRLGSKRLCGHGFTQQFRTNYLPYAVNFAPMWSGVARSGSVWAGTGRCGPVRSDAIISRTAAPIHVASTPQLRMTITVYFQPSEIQY